MSVFENVKIAPQFSPSDEIVVFPGDCIDLLKEIPDESMQLIVTSPPYNPNNKVPIKISQLYYKKGK